MLTSKTQSGCPLEPILGHGLGHGYAHSSLAGTPIAFTQSNATTLRSLDLPQDLRIRQYSNTHENVFYEEEQIHTFSMYLQGGFQTQRTDVQAPKGAPGRFCLMPAGSYSAWQIGGEQNFMHIYFGDDYIKRLALENLDLDPRQLELPHLTFAQSDSLMALVQHSVLNGDWQAPDDKMLLQHNVQTLLLNLLQTTGIKKNQNHNKLKAGLSPSTRSHIEDFVHANYHRQITLEELAKIARLSEYHFARMFKISFAETPQHFISRIRVERLKQRLQSAAANRRFNMAQLALEHGFSNQSHMGRVFKQHVGIAPGQYLRSL